MIYQLSNGTKHLGCETFQIQLRSGTEMNITQLTPRQNASVDPPLKKKTEAISKRNFKGSLMISDAVCPNARLENLS